MACRHTSTSLSAPWPYFAPVTGENPAAHGGTHHMERCKVCAAVREVLVNGGYREEGRWQSPAEREEARRASEQKIDEAKARLANKGVNVLGWGEIDPEIAHLAVGGERRALHRLAIETAARQRTALGQTYQDILTVLG